MNMEAICKEIRQIIFKTAYICKGAHLGSTFSCIEILVALFFGGTLTIDDKFILSKGHAAIALYAVLYKKGMLSNKELLSYYKGDHFDNNDLYVQQPHLDIPTSSLGHGLPFSVGAALTYKIKNKTSHVYCLMGDGECQEGSVWEAALFASHHQLDNLTLIIDSNKLQAMDSLKNIVDIEPLSQKWATFGWETIVVDGHDLDELLEALTKPVEKKPKIIIANTIKGRGVSIIENIPIWHYRMPNEHELDVFLDELGIQKEELGSF